MMKDRPVAEVERHLDETVEQDIEALERQYDAVKETAGDTSAVGEIDSYLDIGIDEIAGHLKRARQWEHKIESHQRGLLNHQQLIEQTGDDDKVDIEAQIRRTEGYVGSVTGTFEQLREQTETGSEIHDEICMLIDELERQQQLLHDLNETLTDVDNEMLDAGFTWMN